jgi:hypothetical protein
MSLPSQIRRAICVGRGRSNPKDTERRATIAISSQLSERLWKQIGRQKAAKQTRLFSVSTGSPLDALKAVTQGERVKV